MAMTVDEILESSRPRLGVRRWSSTVEMTEDQCITVDKLSKFSALKFPVITPSPLGLGYINVKTSNDDACGRTIATNGHIISHHGECVRKKRLDRWLEEELAKTRVKQNRELRLQKIKADKKRIEEEEEERKRIEEEKRVANIKHETFVRLQPFLDEERITMTQFNCILELAAHNNGVNQIFEGYEKRFSSYHELLVDTNDGYYFIVGEDGVLTCDHYYDLLDDCDDDVDDDDGIFMWYNAFGCNLLKDRDDKRLVDFPLDWYGDDFFVTWDMVDIKDLKDLLESNAPDYMNDAQKEALKTLAHTTNVLDHWQDDDPDLCEIVFEEGYEKVCVGTCDEIWVAISRKGFITHIWKDRDAPVFDDDHQKQHYEERKLLEREALERVARYL